MLAKDKVLKGRYRIVNQLGQDETGAVYEAYDSVRKTNVALKEILIDSEKVPAINKRETLKRSFADRAKILAEVKHESLPQIRGFFSEFDRQYLVMELIDGDDANARFEKNKSAFSISDSMNWADQLLDALDYLHTLAPPIIHGDIKPQNVKFTSRGKIKLLGFDIAESIETKANNLITQQNPAATLPYLPLEQLLRATDLTSAEDKRNYREKLTKVLKQPADTRSDVYSLGATLYHLLTAQPPVNALERALAVWAEEFDPLPASNELNPLVPNEISEILARAMEIEPEKRLGSAVEMRQALQTAVARSQERATEETKTLEEAAVREKLLAEEKRIEQERIRVEEERLRLEAEQKQQKELIERQLKAAEAERIKAEQRAAEAEKRLSEEEAKKVAEKKAAQKTQAFRDFSQPLSSAGGLTVDRNDKKTDARSGGSQTLFTESKTDKKTSWLMPAVAVVLLLIGGAAAGMWMMRSSNKVEAGNQIESSQPKSPINQTASQPTTEISTSPTAEKISATSATSASTPTSTEKTASQPAGKNKTTQPPPPRVEKPAATPKPANKKKAITVDDIIGGN